MSHQLFIVRLIKYWQKLKKDKPFANISSFNRNLLSDLMPCCVVINVDYSTIPLTYSFSEIGEQITQIFGSSMLNSRGNFKSSFSPLGKIIAKSGKVFESNEAYEDKGQFINSNNQFTKYKVCYLPYSNDMQKITHIIIGIIVLGGN